MLVDKKCPITPRAGWSVIYIEHICFLPASISTFFWYHSSCGTIRARATKRSVTFWDRRYIRGVTKTKTLENEDLRPVFVFVLRKRRSRSSFSYYENEDPNIKYPKSIEITSLDVHWAPTKVIIDFNTFVHFARGVFLLFFKTAFGSRSTKTKTRGLCFRSTKTKTLS